MKGYNDKSLENIDRFYEKNPEMSNYYISKCCGSQVQIGPKPNQFVCLGCHANCEVTAMIDSPGDVPRERTKLDYLIAQNLADIADVVNEGKPTDIRNLVEAQTKIAYNAGLETERERITELLNEEMLICHQENTPTSRLTSLWNRIKEI